MNVDIALIGLVISIVTSIGGIISHFFIVVKKQVEMDTRLKQVENDVIELKRHLPLMESKINDVHNIVARMDAKQQIIFDQLRK